MAYVFYTCGVLQIANFFNTCGVLQISNTIYNFTHKGVLHTITAKWSTPDVKHFLHIFSTTDGYQTPSQSFRVYSHIELELYNIIFQKHGALQMAHISGKIELLY